MPDMCLGGRQGSKRKEREDGKRTWVRQWDEECTLNSWDRLPLEGVILFHYEMYLVVCIRILEFLQASLSLSNRVG